MARRLVIIGADAAGMSAAAHVRRMTSAGELEIVAFERGCRTSYAACGGPPTSAAGSSINRSFSSPGPRKTHRANGIDVRIQSDGRAARAHRVRCSLKYVQEDPFVGASALAALTSCFLSFFFCLAAVARRFLAVCFLRLVVSI
jgi:hypothetical protein